MREELGDDLVVIADLCLDEYTDHGHCGVLDDDGATSTTTRRSSATARIAVAQAEAGADMVAPSGMMDGQVAAIRDALDAGRLRPTSAIMAYAAKYASASTARSARRPSARRGSATAGLPDGPGQRRRGDPRGRARHRRGRRHRDGQAGAPLPRRHPRGARSATRFPMAAYNVSGEYAMVKAAAAERLDRRARAVARDAHLDPPRRRRPDPHVPREGRGRLAVVLNRS